MTSFSIELPAMLQLEVEAEDAVSALRLIDKAFNNPRPVLGCSVRLQWPVTGIARVVDARALAGAKLQAMISEKPTDG
jgi:hypothetical protein